MGKPQKVDARKTPFNPITGYVSCPTAAQHVGEQTELTNTQ